ncbi:hypothetical protein HN51_065807, partial [Arachis hypogaea]
MGKCDAEKLRASDSERRHRGGGDEYRHKGCGSGMVVVKLGFRIGNGENKSREDENESNVTNDRMSVTCESDEPNPSFPLPFIFSPPLSSKLSFYRHRSYPPPFISAVIHLLATAQLQATGEEQKKLNVLSNKVFVNALNNSGRAMSLSISVTVKCSKYIVVFDHLDGSSNIESGVSIGAIFGIYAAKDKDKVTLDDVLQPRNKMLAAGYYMYGSSCMVKQNTNLMNCSFWICQGCGLEIKPVSHKLKNKILVFVAAGVKLYDLQ